MKSKLTFLILNIFSIVLANASNASNNADAPENTKRTASVQSTQIRAIDFNKEPTPGQDAFWAHNPKFPNQKILLVPSWHSMNFRFIQKDLQQAMKEGDILIIESLFPANSWCDGGKFFDCLNSYATIDELKEHGIIKTEETFNIEGLPWLDCLKFVNFESFEYLQKEIQPSLEDVSLSSIHPDFVVYILSMLPQAKGKRFLGIDQQIKKHYALKNKPILGLENKKELIALGVMKDAIAFLTQVAPIPLDFDDIAKTFIHMNNEIDAILNISDSDESPKESYMATLKDMEMLEYLLKTTTRSQESHKRDLDVGLRNKLWIPKLHSIFNQYLNKFTVGVFGSSHFPGETGILNLLSNSGYTFTPFITKPLTGSMPRSIKAMEPQTEEQRKIATAETQKQTIKNHHAKAQLHVKSALRNGLPDINELGKAPMKPSTIFEELVNAMVRLFKISPIRNSADLLKAYIITRNAIFIDTTIADRKKAHEILEYTPNFDINKVKVALQSIST